MIKFAQLTIYDGLGYLLPGAVLTAALGIIAWSVWAPCEALPILSPSFNLWALLILVAYYVGHGTQGLGNLLLDNDSFLQTKVIPRIKQLTRKCLGKESSSPTVGGEFPEIVVKAANAKAQKLLETDVEGLSFDWVEKVADEALIQLGVCAERNVYVYRMGFYRGSSLSLFVFALAVWIRAVRGAANLYFWGRNHEVYISQLLAIGALCVIASWVFWRRFNHFGRYKRREAILGLMLLPGHKGTRKNGEED